MSITDASLLAALHRTTEADHARSLAEALRRSK